MINTQQIIDRLKELSEDKNKLKKFNNDNNTEISSIRFDIDNDYKVIDIIMKNLIFDVEIYDDHKDDKAYCLYNLSLKETEYTDFDDAIPDDSIRCLFVNEGNLLNCNDVDDALYEILPHSQDCVNLKNKIKRILKSRTELEKCLEDLDDGDGYYLYCICKSIVGNYE